MSNINKKSTLINKICYWPLKLEHKVKEDIKRVSERKDQQKGTSFNLAKETGQRCYLVFH
jgi:hypothetical protein